MANAKGLSLRGGQRPTWRPEREARGSALGVQSRSSRLHRGKVTGEIATAFPRLPRRFAPRNDTSGRRSNGNGAAHRIGGTTAASRTGGACPAPTGPVRIERRPVRIGNAFPRLPRPLWGLAMTRQGSAAMGTVRRTESAVLLPLRGRAWLSPPLQGQCGLNDGRRMIHSSFFSIQYSLFIIHYFIHPPAGDGKPYDKTSGNSLPFVQISPEPPDLSLTTGAFIDKIISENKGAVCPLQQARQPAKNLFVTHDPNTRDQYRRTTQWIKNASLP